MKLDFNKLKRPLLNDIIQFSCCFFFSNLVLSLTKIFNFFQHFKIINNKFAAGNLVRVEIAKSTNETRLELVRYIAKIKCPLCSQIISVSHTFEQLSNGHSGEPVWNTSNLDEHLRIHQNCTNFEIAEENCEYLKPLYLCEPRHFSKLNRVLSRA